MNDDLNHIPCRALIWFCLLSQLFRASKSSGIVFGFSFNSDFAMALNVSDSGRIDGVLIVILVGVKRRPWTKQTNTLFNQTVYVQMNSKFMRWRSQPISSSAIKCLEWPLSMKCTCFGLLPRIWTLLIGMSQLTSRMNHSLAIRPNDWFFKIFFSFFNENLERKKPNYLKKIQTLRIYQTRTNFRLQSLLLNVEN